MIRSPFFNSKAAAHTHANPQQVALRNVVGCGDAGRVALDQPTCLYPLVASMRGHIRRAAQVALKVNAASLGSLFLEKIERHD